MRILQILLFIFPFLCFTNGIMAQNNTIVIGKIKNMGLVEDIELRVDELYINGKVGSYATTIKEDHTFAFALEIKAPQMIKVVYSRNTTDVYLEPYDTLYMEIDAEIFPYEIGFGGTGGFNNNLLVKYEKKFPKKKNIFEYLQYRTGVHWFNVPPNLDAMMQRMSPESFAESMEARKNERIRFVQEYVDENQGGLTDKFIEYIETEINYEYAYYMLCYGNAFKNKHDISRDFFNYLLEFPLESNQIGNRYYREYLKGYLNHLYIDLFGYDVENIYQGIYDLAETQLSDLSLSFFQSELITQALYKKKVDAILDKYYSFLNNNPYYEFNDKVIQAYQKVMKYHAGSPAPSFELRTLDGKNISLSDYNGKPIFLNFWATWCKPCIKKMDQLQAFQKDLEKQGVVFIHVSFDRKEEIWKESVEKNKYAGIHVFLPEATDADISKSYNVRAIPQYYLIDKNGNFAESPEKGTDMVELKQKLEFLLK